MDGVNRRLINSVSILIGLTVNALPMVVVENTAIVRKVKRGLSPAQRRGTKVSLKRMIHDLHKWQLLDLSGFAEVKLTSVDEQR